MSLPVPRPSNAAHTDQLIRAARNGESFALGELYDRFATRLLSVALRLTGSLPDAEDVVHDVFVGLPEALRHYEERGAFGAWLAHITARTALMRLRTGQRRREAQLDDVDTPVSRSRADLAAEYADLERQIAALPEGLRVVFVLKEVEGFSHDEIAALLGISAGTSRVRLSRALERLRAVLRPTTPR
ncbi:MAG: RNA polymerase sigma factor [Gemmatimonadaceae bacterium]|nr:RNA polymerase sigma factor [Gemmatimonadaceae bacterium]